MHIIFSLRRIPLIVFSLFAIGMAQSQVPEPFAALDFQTGIPVETSGKCKVGVEVFKSGNSEPQFVAGEETSPGMLSFSPTSWLGGGLLLHGVEGAVALAEPDDEITVTAWVKPAATSVEGKQTVVGNLDEKEKAGWIFGVYPDGSVLFFWARPDALATIRKTEPLCREGEWHHIGMVWKNNSEEGLSFYVDGIPVESRSGDGRVVRSKGSTPIPFGEAPLAIGTTANGRFPFSGDIRSVRLFDRALDSEEIFQLSQIGGDSD